MVGSRPSVAQDLLLSCYIGIDIHWKITRSVLAGEEILSSEARQSMRGRSKVPGAMQTRRHDAWTRLVDVELALLCLAVSGNAGAAVHELVELKDDRLAVSSLSSVSSGTAVPGPSVAATDGGWTVPDAEEQPHAIAETAQAGNSKKRKAWFPGHDETSRSRVPPREALRLRRRLLRSM